MTSIKFIITCKGVGFNEVCNLSSKMAVVMLG